MRVLLINHEYTISGASLMMLRLADYLLASGHTCSVMAMLSQDGALRADYAARGIGHLDTADFTEYDVAVCNTVFTAPVVSTVGKLLKAVWWIHEGENGIGQILTRPADVSAFSNAAAIVLQTEFQRDSIYRSFLFTQDPGKVFIIPYGVAVEAEGPTVAKARPFRVVCVGSIDARKRQGDLIRALQTLKRDDIECVLIGKLYQLDDSDRSAAEAAPETFRMPGELSNAEARAWLRAADVFCLPSMVESQPISILEAALLGKALLLTDLAPYRGIWSHQKNCILVSVGDVPWLAYSIALLLSSAELRENLGRAARATARQFNEPAFFARFEALFSTIL